MTREIKFRAWDKEEGKMLYSGEEYYDYDFRCDEHGNLTCYSNCPYADSFGEEHDQWIKLDNVMQYTGLKDKNGKDIYEGDILRLWRSEGLKGGLRGEYAYPLRVEYCDLWAQFVVVDEANKEQFGIWQQFGAFEVIGNIYENPGLLK